MGESFVPAFAQFISSFFCHLGHFYSSFLLRVGSFGTTPRVVSVENLYTTEQDQANSSRQYQRNRGLRDTEYEPGRQNL